MKENEVKKILSGVDKLSGSDWIYGALPKAGGRAFQFGRASDDKPITLSYCLFSF